MMPNIWRPFRDLGLVQERVNCLFDDLLTRFGQRLPDVESWRGAWVPAADILETDKELVVKVDLPGLTKNEINLELKDNSLVIRGERKMAEGMSKESFLQLERPPGSFERHFDLPYEVNSEKASARFEDGTLEIVLPKAERAIRKHITIE